MSRSEGREIEHVGFTTLLGIACRSETVRLLQGIALILRLHFSETLAREKATVHTILPPTHTDKDERPESAGDNARVVFAVATRHPTCSSNTPLPK